MYAITYPTFVKHRFDIKKLTNFMHAITYATSANEPSFMLMFIDSSDHITNTFTFIYLPILPIIVFVKNISIYFCEYIAIKIPYLD